MKLKSTQGICLKILNILMNKANEYWEARELQKVLEYKEWRNFNKVLDRAMTACSLSGISEREQFVKFNKPIKGGNDNVQYAKDYKLTRYACYLIVQNGIHQRK